MSKPIKTLLRNEIKKRYNGIDSLAVVSLVGLGGLATNRLRRELRAKKIRVTVVKNAIAKQALKDMGLEPAGILLEGPCALAAGGESVVAVVRELLSKTKDMPALKVKGALMDGEVFPAERIEELSKYPTHDEAIGGLVMLARSPGSRLAAAIAAPAGMLAGIIKTVQERAEKAAPPEAPAAPSA